MSHTSDDYLWDGTGDPDPEVERLERALGGLRYEGAVPEPRPAPPAPSVRGRRRILPWAATLGAVAALVGAGLYFLDDGVSETPVGPAPPQGWPVQTCSGAPSIDAQQVPAGSVLSVGSWLETDDASAAIVRVADIGQIRVEPNSRVRVVHTHAVEHRLELARGRIEAEVVAPPRLFIVDTPSATAVDLGCAYSLEVDDAGDGRLHVTSGSVALEDGPLVSIVPAGAVCDTTKARGPGTPYFEDAPQPLQEALSRFDFGERVDEDVETVLTYARPVDVLTLWHLLPQVEGALRRRVYDRAAGYVAPPSGTTPEGLLANDDRMRELWWDRMSWEW